MEKLEEEEKEDFKKYIKWDLDIDDRKVLHNAASFPVLLFPFYI